MKQKKGMNKSGISEMISYVILIAIAIALSIGVYIWLKDYANISPKIDCKEGTSLRLENYTEQSSTVKLTVKNNGNFNITGFIMTIGNNTERMPVKTLLPFGGGPGSKLGHYNFLIPLKPGETSEAMFTKDENKFRIIQIQPYIKDKKNNIIVCEQAIIKQEVNIPFVLSIPNLISFWEFDEISGTIASDSKDGNKGILIGDVKINQPGKAGTAFIFNGVVGNYVNVSNDPNLNIENQVTLGAWIKMSSIPSSGNYYFVQGKESQYKIDINSSAIIRFLTGNNWPGAILYSNGALSKDAWYHVVATYNGSSKKIYINGIKNNALSTSGAIPVSNKIFTIGAYSTGVTPFNGTIDEVVIFNRALSDEEIENLYNSY